MSTDLQDSDFNDSFGFDDVDETTIGTRGGMREKLPEGGYLFLVTEVTAKNERGSAQIELEVLRDKDGTTGANVGKTMTEFQKWPDGKHGTEYDRIAKEQILAWCFAAKTCSPELIAVLKRERRGFDMLWLEGMVGCQVLAYVKHDTWKDKQSGEDKSAAKIDGRVYALDNPKGKGIPGWIDTSVQNGGGNGGETKPGNDANDLV